LDGYNVIGDALSYPGYVSSVTASGNTLYTWTTSTGDARALQQTVSGRIAAGWYSGASFTVTVNVTGSTMHKVSLYFLDWDASGRNETVVVSDASTSAVYDTEVVSAFSTTPYYLSWNVSTSVVFTITKNAGPNALLNGIFFK
jgi:hypothetical protein